MGRRQVATGAVVGGLAMYFADPQRGRRRRAMAAEKLRSRIRRLRRTTERRQRDRRQRHLGEQLRSEGAGHFHPVDDISVATHLHQVLSELDVPTTDVTVEVVGGIARLRGQLPTPADIDAVVRAVRGQPGVDQIKSYLHLPNEPAPNKAAALAVSHSGRR